ncbi:glycosyltransferase family 1 protein [Nocardioides sp. SYSU D00038]|uniref:glycosyltransferase family 4 protein n=1 Tax=Nocardioides sp. SYSU D00038 TaxID=2812554 RepID=UPI0019676617|nr:glycosyltransferase family 1 protein [Nocardioides sp. SYSU D00038]
MVVDAVGVRPGSSAVILENLLAAWVRDHDDEVVVVSDGAPQLVLPPGVEAVSVGGPEGGPLAAVGRRSLGVRRAAKRLRADAVLSGVIASALAGTPCRRGTVVTDVRHELRPHQFSRGRRLARLVSYGWTFRRADALFCISERTRGDLVRRRPWLRDKAVATLLGSDHVDAWPAPEPTGEAPYAVAFGQFANKNVDKVLAAWAELCRTDDRLQLRLVGIPGSARAPIEEQVAALGLGDRVEPQSWLDDDAFARCFAGASLVVFPSDFEGYGLPVVEALRLGIPVVVSDDPALAEVSGGHAVVAPDLSPAPLAAAMRTALATTPEQRAAGRAWTDGLTWSGMAAQVRAGLFPDAAG